MNTIESKVVQKFHEKNICINCTDRPWYNNAWGSKITVYGIEVDKKDAGIVMDELARLGVDFIVREANIATLKVV